MPPLLLICFKIAMCRIRKTVSAHGMPFTQDAGDSCAEQKLGQAPCSQRRRASWDVVQAPGPVCQAHRLLHLPRHGCVPALQAEHTQCA